MSFRENHLPGNGFPGNVISGKHLKGKVTFRETLVTRQDLWRLILNMSQVFYTITKKTYTYFDYWTGVNK